MGFDSANKHLAATGVRSLKFDNAGESTTGILKDVDLQVVTNTKQEIQYKKDGVTPKEQLVLTLATELRDPSVDGDDGMRKFYCSWRAEASLKDAYRTAGAEGLEPDAKITITYTGDTKVKVPDSNMTVNAKEYTIDYVRPTFAAGKDSPATDDTFPDAAKVSLAQGLYDSGVTDFSVLAKASGLTEAQLQSHIAI